MGKQSRPYVALLSDLQFNSSFITSMPLLSAYNFDSITMLIQNPGLDNKLSVVKYLNRNTIQVEGKMYTPNPANISIFMILGWRKSAEK